MNRKHSSSIGQEAYNFAQRWSDPQNRNAMFADLLRLMRGAIKGDREAGINAWLDPDESSPSPQ